MRVNKKGLQLYAIFFASVWCIKGNSCKFLHEKDGVGCTSLVAKEDWATSGDFIDCKNSRKSNLLLQRSLIRTCGGEIHGLAQFRNTDNLLASKNSSKEHFQVDVSCSNRTSYSAVDKSKQRMLIQEENQRTYGLIHCLDSINDRHSDSRSNYFSGGSSAAPNVYKDINNTYSFGKCPGNSKVIFHLMIPIVLV
ncbi:unnamed protein product [Musa hybrid cultivar]